jgi:hypothetical protein
MEKERKTGGRGDAGKLLSLVSFMLGTHEEHIRNTQ